MWGEPDRAVSPLEDELLVKLLQISGPAHQPLQDVVWEEVLYHYNIWVHLDSQSIERPLELMTQHAKQSSNLASLCTHVTERLNACESGGTSDFSQRLSDVAKVRCVAGNLNLLRLFVHAVLCCHSDKIENEANSTLPAYFYYTDRHLPQQSRNVAPDLLAALIQFVTTHASTEHIVERPEVYDCLVLALELVLVLLSTQLYSNMMSSFQKQTTPVFSFWEQLQVLDAKPFLHTLLNFYIDAPPPPQQSISYHNIFLNQQIIAARGEKVGPDGLYESHLIVQASSSTSGPARLSHDPYPHSERSHHMGHRRRRESHPIVDVTRGVLVLSSSILLLPFRLVSLVYGLWHHELNYDESYKLHMKRKQSNRTRDVFWLSASPLADLGGSLLVLLTNAERQSNAFRNQLANLSDNRWEDSELPDLPEQQQLNLDESANSSINTLEQTSLLNQSLVLENNNNSNGYRRNSFKGEVSVNFENLFETFGRTSHNELGALLLYTLIQSSKTFADSIAVRSDLDTLVLPLLRTLYFATATRVHVATQKGSSAPFRSLSQLYVIIILLLLFTQDPSFGADAFRRVMVTSVPWYKERYLKDISLGSVLILSLLRCLSFVLNRQNDAFLLSNCCAILMNLSSSVVDLHDYAGMRLASQTVSIVRRYMLLRKAHPDNDDDDLTTPTSMHGEASRTLLCVLKHSLSPKNIDKNLHLVYALVYHQTDFKKLFAESHPFRKSEVSRIQKVTAAASKVIESDPTARTAVKALHVLSANLETVRNAVVDKRRRSEVDDFTFTYEEEADPEIFFVPYVWEVIVCAVTSTSIEWQKDKIKVFPLLEVEEEEDGDFAHKGNGENGGTEELLIPQFARDVTDVV